MKNLLTIVLIACFSSLVFGQHENSLPSSYQYFTFTYNSENTKIITDLESKLIELESKLISKYREDTILWLDRIFYTIQRKALKKYRDYTSLERLIDKGEYDCVTGTIVYALILEKLNIEYQILEFPYHVLIVLNIDGKDIMLEATDPYYGFVTEEKDYLKRIEFYKNQSQENAFLQIINLKQLAGLYYYNQAVEEYNSKNWRIAGKWLEKANAFYNSERIQNLNLLVSNYISFRVTANLAY